MYFKFKMEDIDSNVDYILSQIQLLNEENESLYRINNSVSDVWRDIKVNEFKNIVRSNAIDFKEYLESLKHTYRSISELKDNISSICKKNGFKYCKKITFDSSNNSSINNKLDQTIEYLTKNIKKLKVEKLSHPTDNTLVKEINTAENILNEITKVKDKINNYNNQIIKVITDSQKKNKKRQIEKLNLFDKEIGAKVCTSIDNHILVDGVNIAGMKVLEGKINILNTEDSIEKLDI